MDNDIAGVLCIRKYRVCLDYFLGKAVVQALQQEGAQAGACPTSYGMQQHEALERVATISLTIDHLEYLLMNRLGSLVAFTPVVSGTHAILADVKVLRIVNVLVGALLNAVYHPGLEIDEDSSWNIAGVIALVEEDVLAIAALGGKVLEVSILVDAMFLAKLLPELTANY